MKKIQIILMTGVLMLFQQMVFAHPDDPADPQFIKELKQECLSRKPVRFSTYEACTAVASKMLAGMTPGDKFQFRKFLNLGCPIGQDDPNKYDINACTVIGTEMMDDTVKGNENFRKVTGLYDPDLEKSYIYLNFACSKGDPLACNNKNSVSKAILLKEFRRSRGLE